jgi:hypothetical protein
MAPENSLGLPTMGDLPYLLLNVEDLSLQKERSCGSGAVFVVL